MAFTPHFTPTQMLKLGVFGGAYFAAAEPADFEGLSSEVRELALNNVGPFNKKANAFGAKAGQTFEQWQKAGWLFEEDPLGWFQWYCRYNAGRRHERDAHQISRWTAYGERWGHMARWQLRSKGEVSAVVRQGLLQWAYSADRLLAEN